MFCYRAELLGYMGLGNT